MRKLQKMKFSYRNFNESICLFWMDLNLLLNINDITLLVYVLKYITNNELLAYCIISKDILIKTDIINKMSV